MIMVNSYQSAGNSPLRTRYRLNETGQSAGGTETHPMAEYRLGDFLETLERRGAARQHHACPGNSIQPLPNQYLMNPNK